MNYKNHFVTEKKPVQEICFEILDKKFILYHPLKQIIPFEFFHDELKKAAPTARIVSVQIDLVSDVTAKKFDFKTQMEKWNLEIQQSKSLII